MSSCSEEEYQILTTLGQQLADQHLSQIFPDQQPQEIRNILLDMAGRLRPVTKPTPQPLPFAPKIDAKGGDRHLILFTDGASRGNPGKAGAGIQLQDQQGQEILTDSKYLGHATNNEAEYQALILGLTRAQELSASQVEIYLDSELIVRQIQGRYKVKNAGLKPLYGKVTALLSTFDSYTIGHVPRAQNKRADELANIGIDGRN